MIVSERAGSSWRSAVAAVGADEQDRLRLAGLRRRRRSGPGRVGALVRSLRDQVVEREQRGRGRRARREQEDEEAPAPKRSSMQAAGGSRTVGLKRSAALHGPQAAVAGERARRGGRAHEVAERLAVAASARLSETHSSGPWWPPPIGPNSTAGMPASRNEIASDAPSRPTLSASPSIELPDRLAQRLHVRVAARDDRGRARETRTISVSGIARIWARIAPGSWLGRKRMSTSISQRSGTLLNASPPSMRARLIDGAVEQVGRLAAERQRLDAPEDVVGLEDRVVAEPRRRPVRRGAADLHAHREHALGLDADVQVGRLAGDREVALRPRSATSQSVERSSTSSDSSSGTQMNSHAHAVLLGGVVDRAHHRRERALHVVGAAADQAVALDARLELLGVAGDHVEVAVEDHRRRRPGGGPTSAMITGRPSKSWSSTSMSRDSSQPLTNPARATQPVERRGVVRDQPLGEYRVRPSGRG